MHLRSLLTYLFSVWNLIIPAKARDYVFTGVVCLFVCLSVYLFVTMITK